MSKSLRLNLVQGRRREKGGPSLPLPNIYHSVHLAGKERGRRQKKVLISTSVPSSPPLVADRSSYSPIKGNLEKGGTGKEGGLTPFYTLLSDVATKKHGNSPKTLKF